MTRRQACRTLRAITAGLVLLVVALTPLHMHGGGSEAPTVCLLCQVTHQPLELPAHAQAGAWQPAPERVPTNPAPRGLPNAEVQSGEAGNPRAPPTHS